MAGCRQYIPELSQRALDLGLDGLMIESHCNPSVALSDASQQLTPEALRDLLENRLVVRDTDSDSIEYKENIDHLRAQIDVIDENLLFALKSRMAVSRKIGQYKKEHNISIIQTTRWDEVLKEATNKGGQYGLDEWFIYTIFNAIHEASVKVQNEILDSDK